MSATKTMEALQASPTFTGKLIGCVQHDCDECKKLRTQNQALVEAANNLLEQAPCDCSHKRRFDDGEHMSGCYLFDLNLAAIAAAQGQLNRPKPKCLACKCWSIDKNGNCDYCGAPYTEAAPQPKDMK